MLLEFEWLIVASQIRLHITHDINVLIWDRFVHQTQTVYRDTPTIG